MLLNANRRVTQYEVSMLIGKAYDLALNVTNIKSGFRATEIWPVDRSVFLDNDFATSDNLLLRNPSEDGEMQEVEPAT